MLEYEVPSILKKGKLMTIEIEILNKVNQTSPSAGKKRKSNNNSLPMKYCGFLFRMNHMSKTGKSSSIEFMENDNKKKENGDDRCVFLVHGTGGLINPGSCSLDDVPNLVKKFMEVMSFIKVPFYRYDRTTHRVLDGYPRMLPMNRFINQEMKISNMMVILRYPKGVIHCDIIKSTYPHMSKYTREKFPACHVFFHNSSDICFAMTAGFFDECVVVYGLTSRDQIYSAFWCVHKIIAKTHKIFLSGDIHKKRENMVNKILSKHVANIPTQWV